MRGEGEKLGLMRVIMEKMEEEEREPSITFMRASFLEDEKNKKLAFWQFHFLRKPFRCFCTKEIRLRSSARFQDCPKTPVGSPSSSRKRKSRVPIPNILSAAVIWLYM